MATIKSLAASDIVTKQSYLNQLVDIIQEDVSGSATRKTYKVFITGSGAGPGVTSSLFQTVYDQSYTQQTANPIFDVTIGLRSGSNIVNNASTGEDAAGKILFASNSLMMREKIYNYSQYAQMLLGDQTEAFYTPFGSTTSDDKVEHALFINFRRLFARDKVKRETTAIRLYATAALDGSANDDAENVAIKNGYTGSNLGLRGVGPSGNPQSGSMILTDVGSAANQLIGFAGGVGDIVDSSNTANKIGLMFYDMGIAVLNMSRSFMSTQHMSGAINCVGSANDQSVGSGQMMLGAASGNPAAKFIPDLMVSASIDNIVSHICKTRFSNGTLTAMTFQNQTLINSTLIFCRAGVNDFNYSSNPTYTDVDGNINVVTKGLLEKPFSFITGVGLFDASGRLLAVAKLSRPIEKNDEKDLTVRVRLDF